MTGRLLRWSALAATLVVGLVARIRYIDWSIHDDAWISFRYARNLVRGDGLVMNPGERVEGITNFLWTLMAAPVLAVDGDPAHTMQWVGGVLGLMLMAGAYAFTVRRLGGGVLALLTPALLAFNVAFVVESLSGLETLLFSTLLFAAYVAFVEERQGRVRHAGLWAALCGAATMVRPEGALLFAVLAAWAAVGAVRSRSSRALQQAIGIYALLVVPLIAFRAFYYGSVLPNTFYAKVGYTAEQLARGWRYTRYAFVFPLTLPVLAVALAPLVGIVRRWRDSRGAGSRNLKPRDEALGLALLLVATWVAYVWAVGGDYEPTGRFHMPILVLAYLAFQEGLREIATALPAPTRRWAPVALLLAGMLLGARSEQRFLLLLSQRGWPHVRRAHDEQLRAAGRWFNEHTTPNTRIALSSIGALAYFADRPIIDMMGLTDTHIGRKSMTTMGQGAAGHEKGDGAYVLSRRPDIILLDKGFHFPAEVPVETVLEGARGVSEIELVRDPRLAEEYDLLDSPVDGGVLYWLQRKR